MPRLPGPMPRAVPTKLGPAEGWRLRQPSLVFPVVAMEKTAGMLFWWPLSLLHSGYR
jgi:hypothetical protein